MFTLKSFLKKINEDENSSSINKSNIDILTKQVLDMPLHKFMEKYLDLSGGDDPVDELALCVIPNTAISVLYENEKLRCSRFVNEAAKVCTRVIEQPLPHPNVHDDVTKICYTLSLAATPYVPKTYKNGGNK